MDQELKGHAQRVNSLEARKILKGSGFRYPEKAQVLSFMMCKGGVGKSTSAFFVGSRLSSYGARVLVIDADPQGNLTGAFSLEEKGIALDEETPVLLDVISGDCNVGEAIIEIHPHLHLIPSTPMNSNLEGRIREKYRNPVKVFEKALSALKPSYDYIVFDCAPSLNLTNASIICATHLLVLPVAPDKFSRMGLEQTIREVTQIEEDFDLELSKKIVFTKFDRREHSSQTYFEEISKEYPQILAQTVIRTSTDVKNSITKNESLFDISGSTAKADYDSLTLEILNFKAKRSS